MEKELGQRPRGVSNYMISVEAPPWGHLSSGLIGWSKRSPYCLKGQRGSLVMVSSAALGYSFSLVDKGLLSLTSEVMTGLGQWLISVLSALWSQVRRQRFSAKAASPCLSPCCAWEFTCLLPRHHWEEPGKSTILYCSFSKLTRGYVWGNMLSCESQYNPSNRNEYILKRYFNYLIIKTMDPRNLVLGEEKPGPARAETLLSRREIYNLMETKVVRTHLDWDNLVLSFTSGPPRWTWGGHWITFPQWGYIE